MFILFSLKFTLVLHIYNFYKYFLYMYKQP